MTLFLSVYELDKFCLIGAGIGWTGGVCSREFRQLPVSNVHHSSLSTIRLHVSYSLYV